MDIRTLKNCKKVGSFELNKDNNVKKNLNFVKDSKLSKTDYKKEQARVYYIAVNNEIVKIGGSNAKNGISGTISPYCSGNGGRPSDRTYGVNHLIEQSLKNNNKVTLHCQWMSPSITEIPTLFGVVTKEVSFTYKEMEEACLKEYLQHNHNRYPNWNFQEAGRPWPKNIQEGRLKLLGGK